MQVKSLLFHHLYIYEMYMQVASLVLLNVSLLPPLAAHSDTALVAVFSLLLLPSLSLFLSTSFGSSSNCSTSCTTLKRGVEGWRKPTVLVLLAVLSLLLPTATIWGNGGVGWGVHTFDLLAAASVTVAMVYVDQKPKKSSSMQDVVAEARASVLGMGKGRRVGEAMAMLDCGLVVVLCAVCGPATGLAVVAVLQHCDGTFYIYLSICIYVDVCVLIFVYLE